MDIADGRCRIPLTFLLEFDVVLVRVVVVAVSLLVVFLEGSLLVFKRLTLHDQGSRMWEYTKRMITWGGMRLLAV